MPRSYGVTNFAPYAAAPAVGNAGDTYYNSATGITYVSDGTNWNPVTDSLSWKPPCRVAAGSSQTLAGVGQTIDGVVIAAGDRILCRTQGNAYNNGIYVAQAGTWQRASDCNSAADILGATVYATEGTTFGGIIFTCTTPAPITLGTTNLTWTVMTAPFPLDAVHGGTGNAGLGTVHGLLVSQGQSPVTNTGVGTAGQLLMSNGTTADPSYANISSTIPVRLCVTQQNGLTGQQNIDGVLTAVGDRILAVGQTNQANNGIYVAASGAWQRAPDYNAAAAILGSHVYVTEGVLRSGTLWACDTSAPITLGTTPLVFVQLTTQDGWLNASYPFLPLQDRELVVMDGPTFPTLGNWPVGTKIHAQQGGVDYYAAVILQQKGSNATTFPFSATYVAGSTPVTFTFTAHGMVNGDVIYGTPTSGILTTQWSGGTVAWYVVNVAANTFQLSRTRGGTAINSNAGANGAVTFSAGTYLTLSPSADYGITAAATSLPMPVNQYSYEMNPRGWPGWFNYTTGQTTNPLTYTGYSAAPGTPIYQFRVDGNMCTYSVHDGVNGTSNSTGTSMSLPIPASSAPAGKEWTGPCRVIDNLIVSNTPGCLRVVAGATTVTAEKDWGGSSWTASSQKRVPWGQVVYQI